MRLLWTLFKVALALVFVIPVCIIVLVMALGIFGTLLGLAILTLKLAVFGLLAYGAFRLVTGMFGGRSRSRARMEHVAALPPVDPYYEAAKRELDRELGDVRP